MTTSTLDIDAVIGDEKSERRPHRHSELTRTLRETLGAHHAALAELAVLQREAITERFEVSGEIGAGGMGVVYAVRDHDLKRVVAMKLLRGGLRADPADLERFIQEAQITGQLEHPNIVPVHELGRGPDGQVYFVMKHVRGRSLADILDEVHAKKRPHDFKALVRVLLKVCDALAYAHDRGVIHRDLKPDNIMVGRFGEVQVMDWGLAKILEKEHRPRPRLTRAGGHRQAPIEPDEVGGVMDIRVGRAPALTVSGQPDVSERVHSTPVDYGSTLTMQGSVAGTPAYMAPEQARGRGEPLTVRSDVYGLGAILYECLTLKLPYDEGNSAEILRRVAHGGHLVAPSKRTPERLVPLELEAICLKAMSFKPQHRYHGVEQMAEDMQAYLEGRRVSTLAYSPWRQAVIWARTHKSMAIGMASAAALLLMLSLFIAIISAESAAQLERDLVHARDLTEEKQRALASQAQLLDEEQKRALAERENARTERQLRLEREQALADAQRLLDTERELLIERERAERLDRISNLMARAPNSFEGITEKNAGEAKAIYDQVLEMDPDNAPALVLRGYANVILGNRSGAKSDLDRALSIDPNRHDAAFLQGVMAEARDELEDAYHYFTLAIDAAGDDAEFTYFFKRGRVAAFTRRFDQATLDFDDAEMRLRHDGSSGSGLQGVLFNGPLQKSRVMACELRQIHQTEPQRFNDFVELAKRQNEIYLQLLPYMLNHDLLEGRLEDIVRQVEQDGDSLTVRYHVACVYARMGNRDRTVEHLRKAWDLGLRNVEVCVLERDSDFVQVADDSRFRALVREWYELHE